MSYFAMSEFSKVPTQLASVLASIAPGNSAEIEHRGLEAASDLWLGMAYRKLQKFSDAERHLGAAIEATKKLRDKDVGLDRCLTRAVGDDRWPLGMVIALAHIQRAGCRADRSALLEEAQKDLDEAGNTLDALKVHARLEPLVRDGWSDHLAESGHVLLAYDKAVEALHTLQRSAALDPGEADVYLLIARAHARIAERRLQGHWQDHIEWGRDACRRTSEIAGELHPDTRAAAEVEKKLDRIEAGVEPVPDVPTDKDDDREGEGGPRPRPGWQGGGGRFTPPQSDPSRSKPGSTGPRKRP
jgi:tetratricopeptide (TPR) repeat protein